MAVDVTALTRVRCSGNLFLTAITTENRTVVLGLNRAGNSPTPRLPFLCFRSKSPVHRKIKEINVDFSVSFAFLCAVAAKYEIIDCENCIPFFVLVFQNLWNERASKKRRSAQMNTAAISLSDLDWNFDAVPDKELVACCYWEYARESAFIRDTLHQYREWFLTGGDWQEHTGTLMANLEKVQSIGNPSDVFVRGCAFPANMVRQSEDPEKPNYHHPEAPPITGSFPGPWQSLSEDERRFRARIQDHIEQFQIVPIKLAHWSWAKEIARGCQKAADKWHSLRKNWEEKYLRRDAKGNFFTLPGAPEPPEAEPLRPRTRWGTGETLMVDIAWECFTNDEISNYFRKWVKQVRPKEIPKPDDKGRKKARDRRANLTRLAVMRLLSEFKVSEIVDPRQDRFPAIWETKQFAGRKWCDVTKWYDARREAGQLFRKLFPFLPTNEKPFSWERRSPRKSRGIFRPPG